MNGIGGTSNDILFWDSNHWVSAISPDGVYRWNGAAWIVIAPDDPIRTIALDDHSQFEGLSPSSSKAPSQSLYKGNGLSIGVDWIASPGPIHWRPVAFADIEAVGITAPTLVQTLFMRSIPWGGTELRFRATGGRCFGSKVEWVPPPARELILNALPLSTTITPSAAAFLVGLPWHG